MRCPDCNKFVGMENADPEIELSSEFDAPDGILVTAEGRAVRTCVDCGTELKSYDLSMEKTVALQEFPGYTELSPEKRQTVLDALENGDAEIEVEGDGSETEESGGHKYQKNLITTTVNFSVTVTVGEEAKQIVLTTCSSVEEAVQASAYEECC